MTVVLWADEEEDEGVEDNPLPAGEHHLLKAHLSLSLGRSRRKSGIGGGRDGEGGAVERVREGEELNKLKYCFTLFGQTIF